MANLNANNTGLQALLHEELNAANSLQKVLESESIALKSRDIFQLKSAVNNKIKIIQQLKLLSQKRESLLKKLGFPNSLPGHLECIKSQSNSKEILNTWNQLMACLEINRDKNQSNGGLLELSRFFQAKVLQAIRGQNNTRLYDSGGSVELDKASRTIAVA